MTRLVVLGSTGSIGRQTLEVAARRPERLEVVALAAGSDLDALCEQAARVRPAAIALEHAGDPDRARRQLADAAPGARIDVGAGAAARLVGEVDADTVVNGIVGAAGLAASLVALARGRRLALANKETLVVGGPLVRRALANGGELIPIDSEHSAALQLLDGHPREDVAWLTLTASGGALRQHPDWRRATVDDVLAHPVWAMGRRITVDSALLFNKGLELIEAHWLFDLDWPRLDAVIHPEAIVHAWVTFRDGSTLLHAAPPDMALPIQLALSWPERWEEAVPPLSPDAMSGLTFAPLLPGRYPAFDLALAAGRAGGTAPCVLNAADEVAVAAFLDGTLSLGAVPDVLGAVLDRHAAIAIESLDQLSEIDAWAREAAHAEVVRRAAAGARVP
jgi:1-deoxy-D-xylulose-5-phosphate reductoisomerase